MRLTATLGLLAAIAACIAPTSGADRSANASVKVCLHHPVLCTSYKAAVAVKAARFRHPHSGKAIKAFEWLWWPKPQSDMTKLVKPWPDSNYLRIEPHTDILKITKVKGGVILYTKENWLVKAHDKFGRTLFGERDQSHHVNMMLVEWDHASKWVVKSISTP